MGAAAAVVPPGPRTRYRNFTGITNERHQEALSQLARALASGS